MYSCIYPYPSGLLQVCTSVWYPYPPTPTPINHHPTPQTTNPTPPRPAPPCCPCIFGDSRVNISQDSLTTIISQPSYSMHLGILPYLFKRHQWYIIYIIISASLYHLSAFIVCVLGTKLDSNCSCDLFIPLHGFLKVNIMTLDAVKYPCTLINEP